MKTRAKYFAVLPLSVITAVLAGVALAGHDAPPGSQCPQPRFTGKAPAEFYNRVNPLSADRASLAAGRELYQELTDPLCSVCHGRQGAGDGQLAGQFDPPPRNFACTATVDGIPDGQLFWIIENGSPGTAMPNFDYLTERQIWQLVLYLRALSGHE